MKIRVIVTGRQYDMAEALPEELQLPDGSSVGAALEALESHVGPGKLSESCLVAVSGVHIGTLRNHEEQPLRDGDELLVLAPVAGG
jgi:molybdopterin converting factor small subunit